MINRKSNLGFISVGSGYFKKEKPSEIAANPEGLSIYLINVIFLV